MCWIHNVVASVSLFGQNEYIKVLCSINAFLYLCRVLCSIQAPLSLCWESDSVSLFGERETASDRICEDRVFDPHEDRVFDPRSPQLALHNFTSNHVGGKEAIYVHSIYLNILDACVFFFDLGFTSSICVIFVLKS